MIFRKKIIITAAVALWPLLSFPADIVKMNRQQHFSATVPAGDYSGIAWLGGDRYAVVSDKAGETGFFVFRIDIDSVSGRIRSVVNEGYRSARQPNRDLEGIAYVRALNTLFISGEADNEVLEYGADGRPTGRRLNMPPVFHTATANYGLESLTCSPDGRRLWTTSESTLPADGRQAAPGNGVRNRLRLQSFDASTLQPESQYFYEMDAPVARRKARAYAMGVSDLCAMDDGALWVLEREFYVAPARLGSFVNCKLYEVRPQEAVPGQLLPKRLIAQFRTSLSLTRLNLANYEGFCLGPRLSGGRRVVVMVSDSQSGYGGVLKDWFRTLVISCSS